MDSTSKIAAMLDALAEMYAQKQVAELDKQAAIDQVLTPEVKALLSDIETEFLQTTEAVHANIAELEAAVRVQVIALGATVKGAALQACWTRPRVSWDTKALDGYAAAHPEIAQFRKEGEPSVSIRQVGAK